MEEMKDMYMETKSTIGSVASIRKGRVRYFRTTASVSSSRVSCSAWMAQLPVCRRNSTAFSTRTNGANVSLEKRSKKQKFANPRIAGR